MFTSILRLIKKALLILLLLSALIFGALFASENPEKISPILIGLSLPEFSIGLYLCASIFLGILLGGGLSYLTSQRKLMRASRETKAKSRQIKQLEKEMGQRKEN